MEGDLEEEEGLAEEERGGDKAHLEILKPERKIEMKVDTEAK